MNTTTRNATMADLIAMLKDQQGRKVDLVTPASTLTMVDANLVVRGSAPVLDFDGVTLTDGTYRPTDIFDEHLAAKLGIPLAYLRRMRADRPDLYDANANGWLHGRKAKVRGGSLSDPASREVVREAIPGDDRSFLLRTFKGDDDGPGIARALLSDRYAVMDHLDALTAALTGVEQAGAKVDIVGADLTDRRMIVRVAAPEVKALAPELLRGYRSPFTGESGSDNPTVFAGFVIANSETGGGAYTITPRIIVQVCSNGMTITKDAMRAVHLGSRMEEGVIDWSQETQSKTLDLITSRTTDAVRTFLSPEFVEHTVARLSEQAGKPVTTVEEVRDVTKRLGFTGDQIDGVLAQFVQGGQMTMGGVTNAITAYAQTVSDGDEAYDLEAKALAALA